MKITVYGAGYVGLVTAACFADKGNDVLLMDVNEEKIATLDRGEAPIYEDGLKDLLERTIHSKKLKFTTDVKSAVLFGDFQFIAVGTPSDNDGSANLKYVLSVAENIGSYMTKHCIVINKSTVPVETADKVKGTIKKALANRDIDVHFDMASNPEFLKEGSAIMDFMSPDRVIVGAESDDTIASMKSLYMPYLKHESQFIPMDIRSAELSKYAANAILAAKISFMNEMSQIADRVGADIEKIRIGVGTDPRIGSLFINAGCGYGGSCFPKDVKALIKTAKDVGYFPELISAVDTVNQRQKLRLVEKIKSHYGEDLNGKVFSIWGLAFKPNTDDMREAASLTVINALLNAGAKIQAYDPVAMTEASQLFKNQIQLHDAEYSALVGADALVLVTEWQAFQSPDFDLIANTLKDKVIFDGRNLYNTEVLKSHQLIHYAIGRGERITHVINETETI